MGNTHYSNAFKTVAVLLQMFFLIIVIVVFSLLVNLFGRSMFTLSDVGTDSFFDSSYYTKVLSGQLVDLGNYLQFQGSREKSEKDTIKYKQYKMQFEGENSNLYYWYENGGNIRTNMEIEEKYQREYVLKYAREQAASCQKVLGGWANIAHEYATKRYRSNLINWGMLPLLIEEGELPFSNGDYIFLPDIKKAVEEKSGEVKAVLVKDGKLKEFQMTLGEMTDDERSIILKGCLINYNRV